MKTKPINEGYSKAIGLLHDCAAEHGFLASPTRNSNYRRIWGRDGAIMALAALVSRDQHLINTARCTFETLAEHQGPHGEIPANIDPGTNRTSYGGTAGRIDTDLWFIIGCGEYWLATEDNLFLERLLPTLEKVRFLLGAWEFNNRGLLYVPLTGDWADEYLHNGYVLYDQLLYLQAQRTLARIHTAIHGSSDHGLQERIGRLHHLICTNYWFEDGDTVPDDAYHEVLYKKGHKAASHRPERHWLPSFSPTGYGYRFDSLANVLASLLDVASDAQSETVDEYIDKFLVSDDRLILPAFHPVIEPVDEDWEHLQVMFSYTFKNKPYEYHNGGLWPMVTGFYVAALAKRGRTDRARRFLSAIHTANASTMEGEAWGFPEYLNGKTGEPGGTRYQGWSAAAAVIGHHTAAGDKLFKIDGHDV